MFRPLCVHSFPLILRQSCVQMACGGATLVPSFLAIDDWVGCWDRDGGCSASDDRYRCTGDDLYGVFSPGGRNAS